MRPARAAAAGALAMVIGLLVAVVAPAFACLPVAVLAASASRGPVGSVVQLHGSSFSSNPDAGPVEIRWGTPEGALLTSATGPSFRVFVTIPAAAPDAAYPLIAQQRDSSGHMLYRATRMFTVTPTPSTSVPDTPPNPGYRLVAADGGVFTFGSAPYYGSTGGTALQKPIVGMAVTPTGLGYWLVGSDGGIFTFGDAGFFGSTGGTRLSAPIVGMAPTLTGHGYWLVAKDGGIFTFGDAAFLGSTGGVPLAAPVVAMSRTNSGNGYWLMGSDGGIFTFGDAGFYGSAVGFSSRQYVGIATSPYTGYWLADSGGGVVNVGDIWTAEGELPNPPFGPVVGIASAHSGAQHYLAGVDGGVFARKGAAFVGSAAGGPPLVKPVVGITSVYG